MVNGIFEIRWKQRTPLIKYIEKIRKIKNMSEFTLWLCFLFPIGKLVVKF